MVFNIFECIFTATSINYGGTYGYIKLNNASFLHWYHPKEKKIGIKSSLCALNSTLNMVLSAGEDKYVTHLGNWTTCFCLQCESVCIFHAVSQVLCAGSQPGHQRHFSLVNSTHSASWQGVLLARLMRWLCLITLIWAPGTDVFAAMQISQGEIHTSASPPCWTAVPGQWICIRLFRRWGLLECTHLKSCSCIEFRYNLLILFNFFFLSKTWRHGLYI